MTLSRFLNEFFDDNETIYGRAIKAKNCDQHISTVEFDFTIEQLRSDKQIQQHLIELNKNRGIYFVVNEGGGSDILINRFNAAFCEMDDLSLQEQHDIYDNAPLPPSIRVETKKSVHSYWLLNEPILANEFVRLQKGLIKHFKSDKGIWNPSRLMRLPFFNHVSMADNQFQYKRVSVHTFTPTRFSFNELISEYYYEEPKPKPNKIFKKFENNDFQESADELRHRIESTNHFRRKGNFGYTNGFCHNGTESKTALYINYATGYVGCFVGCPYKQIADAFGVTFERGKK